MTKIYHESEVDLEHLKDRRIAVLGYGNLGRPFAYNMHDNGLRVLIGNRQDSYAERARQDGFAVVPVDHATAESNMILMLMPDEVMPQVYLEQVAPYLKTGDMLLFASGYNIAYEFIEPPMFVDVGLLAPRTLAINVRRSFLNGSGYSTFIALHQDVTPHALERLLALAWAVGGLKQGAVEVTFRQEVELDLFWQQAILPAMHGLLLNAAQLLIRSGYPEQAALMELYLSGEMSEFFNQAARQGIIKTLEGMSLTGQYGVLSRTERFHESRFRSQMESVLQNIQSGSFAREWAAEYVDGYPRLDALRRSLMATALWQYEQNLLPNDPGDESDAS